MTNTNNAANLSDIQLFIACERAINEGADTDNVFAREIARRRVEKARAGRAAEIAAMPPRTDGASW